MGLTKINGVQLETAFWPATGPGKSLPAVVLLHEGLGSVSLWRDWPAQVRERTGRTVLAYSRRGYGLSDTVPDVRGSGRLGPDYMHREALEVLPALLDALSLQRPVLLGHSDGGSIALLHASAHEVSACIVMAPHVMVEDVSVKSIAEAREAYLAGDLRERLKRHHRDVDCAFWQWNDVWLSDAFRSFDIRPQCRSITAPLLAVQGQQDPYGTLAQIEDIRKAAAQTQLLALEACGHSPHRDQPEPVLKAVADFLSSLADSA
jgi:pimeloyl-ACP methyl ester carboxylesterase